MFGVIFLVVYSGSKQTRDSGGDVKPVPAYPSTEAKVIETRDDAIAENDAESDAENDTEDDTENDAEVVIVVNRSIVESLREELPRDPDASSEADSGPIVISPRTEDEGSGEDGGGRAPDPAPAGPNNRFGLTLGGVLGGAQLDPADPQTWAQIGYFLQNLPTPYYLVFPGGSSPLIRKKDGKGKLIKPPSSGKQRRGPFGDSSNPTYRLHIKAAARASGTITFYGRAVGKKYVCELNCRLEKVEGDGFKTLDQFTIVQRLSPILREGDTSSRFLRQSYDQATEKLIRRLKSARLFQE